MIRDSARPERSQSVMDIRVNQWMPADVANSKPVNNLEEKKGILVDLGPRDHINSSSHCPFPDTSEQPVILNDCQDIDQDVNNCPAMHRIAAYASRLASDSVGFAPAGYSAAPLENLFPTRP